ncbi:Acyl-CoA dehydrogenase [Alteripontixanthobacter maritimus]|uniref:Acyl-CoA dehydrogenase n=1 Tax=Alteripontixanthobacter maritimus TaxID=2161824 RepID=A0A369Q9A4_9SPHN|nr:acyl-CoA dehydrogenase family protein [Alteripontixanthobacter maritimus]RDC58868.1 Acyl-CoA dehydrogenase [Alteripontixanthobacter maritimus]
MTAIPSENGMDAETFDQFIEQLQRYVRERLIPAESQVIADNMIPEDLQDEMRGMGLFGLTMPEEYGGAGMNVPQYVEAIRVLSYALPAYRSLTSINLGMVCSAIKKNGTDEQKAEYLPGWQRGEIACFGLTEPGSGSDSAADADHRHAQRQWLRAERVRNATSPTPRLRRSA